MKMTNSMFVKTEVWAKGVEWGSQHMNDSWGSAFDTIPREFVFEKIKKMTL